MSDKFWLWATAIAFAALMAGVLWYARSISIACEERGGTMVRTLTLSGWSCVQFPLRRDTPH
jgi:hypothetical protein